MQNNQSKFIIFLCFIMLIVRLNGQTYVKYSNVESLNSSMELLLPFSEDDYVFDVEVELIYTKESHKDVEGSDFTSAVDYELHLGSTGSYQSGELGITYQSGEQSTSREKHKYESSSSHLTLKLSDPNVSPIEDLSQGIPYKDIEVRLYATPRLKSNGKSSGLQNVSFIDYEEKDRILSWGYNQEAYEYEVEWLYIDDHSEDKDLSKEELFEKYQGVTVRLEETFYEFDPILPEGKVYFRVRPILDFVGYESDLLGRWRYNNESGDPVVLTITAHDLKKNWSYTTVFAEGGREKAVISYSDALGNNRQTKTIIESDENVMVGEAFYDYEGRATLNVLPFPEAIGNRSRKEALSYMANANTFAATGDKDKSNYDRKEGALPFSKSRGAAKYYSSENDVNSIHRDYIPDANGYVFSQAQLMQDQTGRVSSVSGLGETFAKKNDHDVKTYYSEPTEYELKKLFGEHVGSESKYKKVVSIDQNKQASVTYLDLSGRTIATGLLGRSPSNMKSLASVSEIKETSILDSYDGVSNESVTTHTIDNLEEGQEVGFHYEFDGGSFEVESDVCVACKYKLTIELFDPFGNSVDLDVVGENEQISSRASIEEIYGGGELLTMCGTRTHAEFDFSASLVKIGPYSIVKTLEIEDPDVEALTQYLIENPVFTSIPTVEELEIELADKTDFTVCIEDCEERCIARADRDIGGGNLGYEEALQACEEECSNEFVSGGDPAGLGCDFLLGKMANEYGYEGVHHHEHNGVTLDDLKSLLNMNEDLVGLSGSEINSTSDLWTVSDFDPEWSVEIAKVYHPDISQYYYCELKANSNIADPSSSNPEFGSMDSYYNQFLNTHTLQDAEANGMLNPFLDADFSIFFEDEYDISLDDLSRRDDLFDAIDNEFGCDENNPDNAEACAFFDAKIDDCQYVKTDALASFNNFKLVLRNDDSELIVKVDPETGKPYRGLNAWEAVLIFDETLTPEHQDGYWALYQLNYESIRSEAEAELRTCLGVSEDDVFADITFEEALVEIKQESETLRQELASFDAIGLTDQLLENCDTYIALDEELDAVLIAEHRQMVISRIEVYLDLVHIRNPENLILLEDVDTHPVLIELESYLAANNLCSLEDIAIGNAYRLICPYEINIDYKTREDKFKDVLNEIITYFSDKTDGTELDLSSDEPEAISIRTQLKSIGVELWNYPLYDNIIRLNDVSPTTYDLSVDHKDGWTIGIMGDAVTPWIKGELISDLWEPDNTPYTTLFTYGSDPHVDRTLRVVLGTPYECTEAYRLSQLRDMIQIIHDYMQAPGSDQLIDLQASPLSTTAFQILDMADKIGLQTTLDNYSTINTQTIGSNTTYFIDDYPLGYGFNWDDVTHIYPIEKDNGALELTTDLGVSEVYLRFRLDYDFTCEPIGQPVNCVYVPEVCNCHEDFVSELAELDFSGSTSVTIVEETHKNLANDIVTVLNEYLDKLQIKSIDREKFLFVIDDTYLPEGSFDYYEINGLSVYNSSIDFGDGRWRIGADRGIMAISHPYVEHWEAPSRIETILNESHNSSSETLFHDLMGNDIGWDVLSFDRIRLKEPFEYDETGFQVIVTNNLGEEIEYKALANKKSNEVGLQTCTELGYTSVELGATSDYYTINKDDGTSFEMFFYNEAGERLDLTKIVSNGGISQNEYVTLVSPIGSGTYTGAEVVFQYLDDNGDVHVAPYYLYASDPNEIFFNECRSPVIVIPDDPEGPCKADLLAGIKIEAQNIYNSLIATMVYELITEPLDPTNSCRGITEKFTMTKVNDEYHHTLYYYDVTGDLVQTVPPAGVDYVEEINGTYPTPDHGLATQYTYNSIGQLVTQHTPDGGDSKFWYDSKGRIRLSQNAEQAARQVEDNTVNRYAYTKYDELGRVEESGELLNLESELATNLRGAIAQNGITLLKKEENIAKSYELLDNLNFPLSLDQDDEGIVGTYTTKERTFVRYDKARYGYSDQQKNLRNRIGYTFTRQNIGESIAQNTATFYSYDIHGNVTDLWKEIGGLGVTHISYEYDLISGNVNKVLYNKGHIDQYFHKYTYDLDNRLIAVATSSDDEYYQEDAHYYYYAHGSLARVELGDETVQGMDYFYTLQGWLKGMNIPDNINADGSLNSDVGQDGFSESSSNKYVARDEFSMGLSYYSGDYKAIGGIENVDLGALDESIWGASSLAQNLLGDQKGLYNGNISMMVQQVHRLGELQNIGIGKGFGEAGAYDKNFGLRAQAFTYDQLNRISSGKSFTNYDENSWAARSGDKHESYDVEYSYDANGNIKTLKRWGKDNTLIDDLKYTYNIDLNFSKYERILNNQLLSVHDKAGQVQGNDLDTDAGDYSYDERGNMLKDALEEIGVNNTDGVDVEWRLDGKVSYIRKYNRAISFLYDAMGNRVVKKISDPGGRSTDYYVLDASGNALANYTYRINNGHNQTGTFTLTERPIYGASRIGLDKTTLEVRYEDGREIPLPINTFSSRTNHNYVTGSKQYELSNHLGNVMAVVTDIKEGVVSESGETYYQAQVVAANDYYPFGWTIADRTYSSEDYRYGFNGAEKDDEVKGAGGHYDLGLRHYDARLGRMFSVDPRANEYAWQTSYAYHRNSPIGIIDYLGGGGKKGDASPKGENGSVPPPPGGDDLVLYDPERGWYDPGVMELPTIVLDGSSSSLVADNLNVGVDISSSISGMSSLNFFDWNEVSELTEIVNDFVVGASQTVKENYSYGIVSAPEPISTAQEVGQFAGEVVTVLGGVSEVVGGEIVFGVGAATTVTSGGVASVISVPVAIAGQAVAVHGSSVVIFTIQKAIQKAIVFFEPHTKTKNGSKKRTKKKHQKGEKRRAQKHNDKKRNQEGWKSSK